jgi:hypothetical protein
MPWNKQDRQDALDRADAARRDHLNDGHGRPARRASEGETQFVERRLPDGSVRTNYPDGSTRVRNDREGTNIKTDTDGTISIEFTNGDEDFARVVFHPDGSRTLYPPDHKPGQPGVTIPKDGWLTDDGVAERLPDGTIREVELDGDVIYTNPDGTPAGGYDGNTDVTSVIGDGWIAELWHDWGRGEFLDINPFPAPAPPAPMPAPAPPAPPEQQPQSAIEPEPQAEAAVAVTPDEQSFDEWVEELEASEAAAAEIDAALEEVEITPEEQSFDEWVEQLEASEAEAAEAVGEIGEPAPPVATEPVSLAPIPFERVEVVFDTPVLDVAPIADAYVLPDGLAGVLPYRTDLGAFEVPDLAVEPTPAALLVELG